MTILTRHQRLIDISSAYLDSVIIHPSRRTSETSESPAVKRVGNFLLSKVLHGIYLYPDAHEFFCDLDPALAIKETSSQLIAYFNRASPFFFTENYSYKKIYMMRKSIGVKCRDHMGRKCFQ